MESHLATECPQVEISCEFGCQEKVQRKNMANHIQRNQAVHLSLLNGKVLELKKLMMGGVAVALIVIVACFFYILWRK